MYRVWVDHLRATGQNAPVPRTRKDMPFDVAHRLVNATTRRPADKAIPRDVFNWLFDDFDDGTDGFELPEAPRRPLPEREQLPFVIAEHCLLKAAGRSDEIQASRLAELQRLDGHEDVADQMDWVMVRSSCVPGNSLLRPQSTPVADLCCDATYCRVLTVEANKSLL